MFDYEISDRFTDNPFNEIPEHLGEIVNKAQRICRKKGHRNIQQLKQWVKKHPEIPALHNYLATAYIVNGKRAEAKLVNAELFLRFPGYLFGRVAMAKIAIEDEEYEKVPPLLKGNTFDLRELYPERKIFHRSEVRAYHATVCEYLIYTGELEEAETHLTYLEQVDPNHAALEYLRGALADRIWFQEMEELEKKAKAYKYKALSYDMEIQTEDAPNFHHSEIQYLYENGLDIDSEKVKEILALPRVTLIEDLDKVLKDCVWRYEYFDDYFDIYEWSEEKGSFSVHALFLLSELKAEESIDALFYVMRQGEELSDFWFADIGDQIFTEALFHIAAHQLDRLKAFTLEKKVYYFYRSIPANVVSLIAQRFPERRTEAIQWFEEVIAHILENKEEVGVVDFELNGCIVAEIMDFNGVELLPIIEKLYDAEIVDEIFCGDFEMVKVDITEKSFNSTLVFDNVFERYNHWKPKEITPPISTITPPTPPKEEKKQPKVVEVRKTPKVGRNAPCPCGSGKKYKRCHGKK